MPDVDRLGSTWIWYPFTVIKFRAYAYALDLRAERNCSDRHFSEMRFIISICRRARTWIIYSVYAGTCAECFNKLDSWIGFYLRSYERCGYSSSRGTRVCRRLCGNVDLRCGDPRFCEVWRNKTCGMCVDGCARALVWVCIRKCGTYMEVDKYIIFVRLYLVKRVWPACEIFKKTISHVIILWSRLLARALRLKCDGKFSKTLKDVAENAHEYQRLLLHANTKFLNWLFWKPDGTRRRTKVFIPGETRDWMRMDTWVTELAFGLAFRSIARITHYRYNI